MIEREKSNPAPNSNNWYAEDGYGGGEFRVPRLRRRVLHQLFRCEPSLGSRLCLTTWSKLPYEVNPKCDPGHYYLVNN